MPRGYNGGNLTKFSVCRLLKSVLGAAALIAKVATTIRRYFPYGVFNIESNTMNKLRGFTATVAVGASKWRYVWVAR